MHSYYFTVEHIFFVLVEGRLADILEDTINIVICLHMVVSTIPLCTSTYQMLLSFARLEKVYISTFLTYFCLPLCTLCGYCYTDECLIEEVINRILIQLQFNIQFDSIFY
ncbi:odorant receptor 13a-like [Vespula squamosa]|uniref:Odorant receptor 13a-like n=1 Tax=Vespula squamosa TaxID=30214 RepID=A0ABD2BEL0_VESSQ